MIFNQTELVTLVLPDQSEATPLDSSNHRDRVNLLIVIEVIRTTRLHFFYLLTICRCGEAT
jgi:hypothetical protein